MSEYGRKGPARRSFSVDTQGFERRMQLRRRRSRMPWIYAVYHARRRPPSRQESRSDGTAQVREPEAG